MNSLRVSHQNKKRPAWRESLVSRTLALLALSVGLIILFATCVTYYLVYRAAESRETAHLDLYNRHRAGQLAARCDGAAWNLRIVSDAFVERMRQSDPMEFETFWDNTFERTEDGAWRSVVELSDPRKYPSLWANRSMIPLPDTKRELLVMYDVSLRFLPAWLRSFGNLYGFTLDEMAIVGFDASQSDWARKLPADFNVAGDPIGKAACREGNPARELVWTGLRTDTLFGGDCVTAVLPVEMDRQHTITLIHHIAADSLLGSAPEKFVFLLTGADGKRIAASGETAFSLEERISAGEGFDRASDSYYASCKVLGPGWEHYSILPRSVLRAEAFESARWVLWSGLISLALVLLVLGAILRSSIEQPIEALVQATSQLAEGNSQVSLQTGRKDELGVLSRSFDEMVEKLRQRDQALQQEKASLELRVAKRTAELREASQRLAVALAQEKELVQLKSNFVSLVSHEFRTPLEIITSSAFNLEKYHDRLSPERRDELLHTIQTAVERMAAMMVQVVFLGQMEPGRTPLEQAPIDLETLCREIAREIEAATAHRCPIRLTLDEDTDGARGDPSVLRHILTNLLSNAVKYSPDGAEVEFSLQRKGKEAKFIIVDHGCGIPEADQSRLFCAFHRGGNTGNIPGTGLGLVIVKRCVEAHGGRILYYSREREETVFIVTLPLFET